jgi:beta-glucanase (GH16 family)
MMPRKSIMLASLLLAFGMTACGSDDDPIGPSSTATISTSVSEIVLDATAQSTNLVVSADADWSITSNQDWCSVFPSGGVKNESTTVKVTVTANSGFDAREAVLKITSGASSRNVTLTQNPNAAMTLSTTTISAGAQGQNVNVTVTCNGNWTASSNASWCKVSPTSGTKGETTMVVAIDENTATTDRGAEITVTYDGGSQTISVVQLSDAINTPEGYTLVWNDEFSDLTRQMPDESIWWYETGDGGWGNNEIQNYVAGKKGSTVVAEQSNGTLKINLVKSGSEILSARINSVKSWTYGYFEARLKLPKGKGTWPAFWMMPEVYTSWPKCGEIDIMEEVGYNPNYTSSTIHCSAYNGSAGTQKTAEQLTANAQDEFHVYALEWTADYIKTYVDGQLLFTYYNDQKGDDATWPFHVPFYLKLNLAWGGSWGGAKGVDESCLPATYEIDYVRVFQKQ